MGEVISWIVDPLGYAFMVRGLIAAVVVGGVCAILGTYVILRGMALFGHSLAHAVLPGVAVAYLLGGANPVFLFLGGLIAGVLTAAGIGFVSREGLLKEDTATGVVFIGMFALGIALISTVRSFTADLTHFLFGNVLGVATSDLWLTAVFGALVLVTLFLFYKELLVYSFDPVLAKTLRLPTTFLNYVMLVLMAITIVLSLQTVGIALMSAMLVTPAGTAYLLSQRLPMMMVLSAGFGTLSAVGGLYLSFYINIASGPAIVLLCTLFFLLAFIFSPRTGLIKRWKFIRRKQPNSGRLPAEHRFSP
ncbi:MAG TPA: metal ABC transporter permease [Anaerolineae bacterium]|nr:metal ABC transporter permease [Anaerolineae bacterium]HMR66313.1 metal ABC transporter permease [Anaerolineae bacterium]